MRTPPKKPQGRLSAKAADEGHRPACGRPTRVALTAGKKNSSKSSSKPAAAPKRLGPSASRKHVSKFGGSDLDNDDQMEDRTSDGTLSEPSVEM